MSLSSVCEAMSESEVATLGDFHPLVIAQVTIHWARLDRDSPMKGWAWEAPTTKVRNGDLLYYVANNAQQAEPFIQVTEEHEPTKEQKSWRLDFSDIRQNGTKACARRI